MKTLAKRAEHEIVHKVDQLAKSMIRKAEPEDVQSVVERARAFHAYSPWRDVPFDPEAMKAFLLALIEAGGVFISETGMCCGTVASVYFNPSFRLAVELAWWAPAGDGKDLRKAFELWAVEQGANGFQYSALADDHLPAVTRMYRHAGFEPAEMAFIKRVA